MIAIVRLGALHALRQALPGGDNQLKDSDSAGRILTGDEEQHRASGTRRSEVWLLAGGSAVITDNEARDVHRLEVR